MSQDETVSAPVKDAEITLPEGAQRLILHTPGGSLVLRLEGGSLILEAPGDLHLRATGRMSFEATQISMRSRATLELESMGPATLKSSAITTIQGGLVKIN